MYALTSKKLIVHCQNIPFCIVLRKINSFVKKTCFVIFNNTTVRQLNPNNLQLTLSRRLSCHYYKLTGNCSYLSNQQTIFFSKL